MKVNINILGLIIGIVGCYFAYNYYTSGDMLKAIFWIIIATWRLQ